MKKLTDFETYFTAPDGYAPLTYAYDLLNERDQSAIVREMTRLESHEADAVIVMFDTREHMEPVRVEDERVSYKPSLWGEIWKRS